MHAVVATGGRPRSSWEAAREKTNPQAAGGQDVDLPAPRGGGGREGRRPNQVPRTTGCEVADQRTPKEDTKRARRELKKQTALLLREGRGRAGEKEAETHLSPNGTRGGMCRHDTCAIGKWGGTTPVHQQECKRAQAPYSTPVSVNVTWPAEKR